jgi:hypothetical protein
LSTVIRLLIILTLPRSNGAQCLIGSHLQSNALPPKVGSLITVKHSGYYKNGSLRHPFAWRLLCDQGNENKDLVFGAKSNHLVVLYHISFS